jgi:hypothetical protein
MWLVWGDGEKERREGIPAPCGPIIIFALEKSSICERKLKLKLLVFFCIV